jgi:YD repeat-containing protein
MKLNYHADTDSLYIDLSDRPGVETREVSEGVALDYDADGNLVGIDIDNASKKVEMNKLVLSKLPATMETVAA